MEFKTDADVAHYSIMVSRLPKDIPPKLLQKRIKVQMQNMFGDDFMEVRVLGNYDKLYALCKKLKRNIEKQKVTEGTKR